MQAEPAELRIRAGRSPTVRENPDTLAFGMSRKQKHVGFARAGKRLDESPRGFAERHGSRAGLRIRERDGVLADIAPAQIEHFAPAASGEREQPDRGDGFRPAGFVGVERAPLRAAVRAGGCRDPRPPERGGGAPW